MRNQKLFTVILISFLIAGAVLAEIPTTTAQNTAIFGYPYKTASAGGSGSVYTATGSLFTLNSTATITSISCLMNGGFNPSSPNDVYCYRYAIYNDNQGIIGTLVSQTEEGLFVGALGGSYDVWKTASFNQPVSLGSGSYWLMAVHNATQYINIHNEYPATGYTEVSSTLVDMTFPSNIASTTYYGPDAVICIYASGQGAPMVIDPIGSSQRISQIFIGCTIDPNSNTIEITGNLTTSYKAIASEQIFVYYKGSNDSDWLPLTVINTDVNGGFSVNWSPPEPGNYIINATYIGNSNRNGYSAIVNAVVLPPSGFTQSVLSVNSNSTVTNFAFDSRSDELSFSVSGEANTQGFVEVFIAKSLVSDPSTIKAFIDNAVASYSVSSIGDSWVLYFSYHHSSHQILFALNEETTTSTNASPTNTANATPIPEISILALVTLILVLVVGTLVISKRKGKTTIKSAV